MQILRPTLRLAKRVITTLEENAERQTPRLTQKIEQVADSFGEKVTIPAIAPESTSAKLIKIVKEYIKEVLAKNEAKVSTEVKAVAEPKVAKLTPEVINPTVSEQVVEEESPLLFNTIFYDESKAVKPVIAAGAEIDEVIPKITLESQAKTSVTPQAVAAKEEVTKSITEEDIVDHLLASMQRRQSKKTPLLERMFGKKQQVAKKEAPKAAPVVAPKVEVKPAPVVIKAVAPAKPKAPSVPVSKRLAAVFSPVTQSVTNAKKSVTSAFTSIPAVKNFIDNRAGMKAASASAAAVSNVIEGSKSSVMQSVKALEAEVKKSAKAAQKSAQTLQQKGEELVYFKKDVFRPQVKEALDARRAIQTEIKKGNKAIDRATVAAHDLDASSAKIKTNIEAEAQRVGQGIVNSAVKTRLDNVSEALFRFQEFAPSIAKLDEEQFRRVVDRVDFSRAVATGTIQAYARKEFITGSKAAELMDKIALELSSPKNEIAKTKLTAKLKEAILKGDNTVAIAETKKATEIAIGKIKADETIALAVKNSAEGVNFAAMTKEENVKAAKEAYAKAKAELHPLADKRGAMKASYRAVSATAEAVSKAEAEKMQAIKAKVDSAR